MENIREEQKKSPLSRKSMRQLEELVDDLSSSVANNFLQTIQVLASVSTLHERFYDGSHSRFVSSYSARVAEKLKMNEVDVFEIKTAALLHDLGKTGFKDTLLYKNTGEMSSREFHHYAKHPELGMQLLKKHHGFDSIGEIIYQHHEKLDGSGFPRHLSGKNLHPGAAIISVVDAYHNTMFKQTRDRTNTDKSSINYASSAAFLDTTKNKFVSVMNYLHQKKNSLFNSKVVEVFTEMITQERRRLGFRTVHRIPVNKVEDGMLFAEDYFTSYGLLIAARGEAVTRDMAQSLIKFAEAGHIPLKILVMK